MLALFLTAALAQTVLPEFEIAKIEVSPKSTVQNRSTKATATTYEVRNATMLDLISIAWGGYPPDRILGGPNWLELDRFGVIGKIPPGTPAEDRRLMLRPLLEKRFQLAAHSDTRPVPVYALTPAKKILLKEADGKGEVGCKRIVVPSEPGQMKFTCRNISMASFAEGMRSMGGGSYFDYQTVADRTRLEGRWNFDLAFSFPMAMINPGEFTSFPDALEKQLGLKLERVPVPTPVLVVDSVNRRPTANPPEAEAAFPAVPVPTEFEVADVKLSAPGLGPSKFMTPVGGRLDCERIPLSFLIRRAFHAMSSDQVAGVPGWADSEQIDIAAKAPTKGLPGSQLDDETVAPMLLALLKERFHMTWHTENRTVTAYTLKAAKPKLTKADPSSRTRCKDTYSPVDAAPGSVRLTCQNVTIDQFAERLQTRGIGWPIENATALEGGFDLILTYLQNPRPIRSGNPAEAADPSGGLTLFEAIQRQLGLRLEAQKRTEPVIVIDRIDPAPTEN